ncbi:MULTISPECIES: hypothetical protein [unclassified Mesorhizobium]|uniref:hypothetical protein n=1 Tax=unclassified Mesorhizobium TaxID=325217 RepID=UPI00112C826F|nr:MULTISPECIES: hypothetical protein [unclassified Mesorhizobium]TPN42959.1 hypothetical protein FJ976_29720 [Mesorhizobium sp. B1-1-9]TPN43529.1 hypothetical protein FJ978_31025 [Mesorhizobium sp. B1-1-7]
MRSRLLALGLFSVAAVHPVLAAQPDPATAPGDAPPMAMQGGPDHGPMPWFGQNGPTRHGPQNWGPQSSGPQEGFGPRRMGPPPEFMLAARLAALETRVGIRSEQLDAWRDYTSALQAVLTPPRHDRGPGATGGPDAGGPEAKGPDVKGPDAGPGGKADAFAFQERLADEVTARAASAAKLKDAIAELRTKLTPEQLEILASAERPHGPPPGPWGGPPDDAAGPGGPPDQGGQLPPPQPGNG